MSRIISIILYIVALVQGQVGKVAYYLYRFFFYGPTDKLDLPVFSMLSAGSHVDHSGHVVF